MLQVTLTFYWDKLKLELVNFSDCKAALRSETYWNCVEELSDMYITQKKNPTPMGAFLSVH